MFYFKTSFKNAFIGVASAPCKLNETNQPYDSVSGESVVQRRGIRDYGSYRQASRLQMGLPTLYSQFTGLWEYGGIGRHARLRI